LSEYLARKKAEEGGTRGKQRPRIDGPPRKAFNMWEEFEDGTVRMAAERMGLSARAYHRVLKLSRTIADLAGSDAVLLSHLAEAIQYRPR
jgi:magnesium chelatase family protein